MNNRRDNTTLHLTITYALVASIVIAVILYLYFLNVSVVHVIMRKEATQDVNQLRTQIAILETEYITAQHTIASQMGTLAEFTTDAEKIFVHRDQSSLVLRDN
jgi:hypothetical protein